MEVAGKNALVVGLAESGAAAAALLASRDARVTVTDLRGEHELEKYVQRIKGLEVEMVLGEHPREIFERAHLVVASPGVSAHMNELKVAAAAGAEVVSELELAASFIEAPLIAVTGTNGKSTTVEIAGHIMRAALGDEEVFVGGNIGTPLSDLPLSARRVKVAVVEVSSFQLELARDFRPRVAVMLNITPDHMDRHHDLNEYARMKERIFQNQDSTDTAVINADDPLVARMAEGLRAGVMEVSLVRKPGRGMWLNGDVIKYEEQEKTTEVIQKSAVPLHGGHNILNLMAAACACIAAGAGMEKVREAVPAIKGLAHRLVLVRELRGARFYNDSKATNPGAVKAAVSGLSGPVILLMGGQAKGLDFYELAREVSARVKQVMAFGESGDRIKEQMGESIAVTRVETMEQALTAAVKNAAPGDAVLLAPGCASFDQFEDYSHRGRVFERMVGELV